MTVRLQQLEFSAIAAAACFALIVLSACLCRESGSTRRSLPGRRFLPPKRINMGAIDASVGRHWINLTRPTIMVVADTGRRSCDRTPSRYAITARAAGLELVTWTLERSGSLEDGGGFYYQSISDAIDDESDMLKVLDVLARDVGVSAVFSGWPAAVTGPTRRFSGGMQAIVLA